MAVYGADRGRRIRFAEAFEICQYGRQPTPKELKQLFPFLPSTVSQSDPNSPEASLVNA